MNYELEEEFELNTSGTYNLKLCLFVVSVYSIRNYFFCFAHWFENKFWL